MNSEDVKIMAETKIQIRMETGVVETGVVETAVETVETAMEMTKILIRTMIMTGEGLIRMKIRLLNF